MRILWALPFLLAVGCGGSDLSIYEDISDAMIQARKDLADALDDITDKESAEAARPVLVKIAKRENEIYSALEKLGEPGDEERRRFKAKVDAAREEINARMDKTVERLRADPETWAVVEAMMEEVFATADSGSAEKRVGRLRLEKKNNVMELVFQLTHGSQSGGKLPMEDGVLDVYAIVRDGKIGREMYSLLRDPESGLPTDEEIDRGDYTNFPYERYRGNGDWDPMHPVPFLWDKEPDVDGVFVVGMSDLSGKEMDEVELATALGK